MALEPTRNHRPGEQAYTYDSTSRRRGLLCRGNDRDASECTEVASCSAYRSPHYPHSFHLGTTKVPQCSHTPDIRLATSRARQSTSPIVYTARVRFGRAGPHHTRNTCSIPAY